VKALAVPEALVAVDLCDLVVEGQRIAEGVIGLVLLAPG
jgi:hypothetical protein